MIILTAGDHRFRNMIRLSRAQAERFGYEFRYCDLGDLDLGGEGRIRYDDSLFPAGLRKNFAERGYYLELEGGWRSHALHKPFLVRECLRQGGDLIAYLDGDAIPAAPIDEVMTHDYDVGVVLRPRGEITDMPEHSGVINAGVLFFSNTERTRDFVEKWMSLTRTLGSDQVALNEIVFPDTECWYPFEEDWRFHTRLRPGRIEADGLVIRLFDFRYNCYTAPLPGNCKILHFKGSYRRHFDLRWLRRSFGMDDGEEPQSPGAFEQQRERLFNDLEHDTSKRGKCPVVIDDRLFRFLPLFFLEDPVGYLCYRCRVATPFPADRSPERDVTTFELPPLRRKTKEIHIVAKMMTLSGTASLAELMDPDSSHHPLEQISGPVGYVLLGRRAVFLYKRHAPSS